MVKIVSRVLLCDPDNEWLVKSTSQLEQSQIEIQSANNGKVAQGMIYKNQYNSIVIDLNLREYSCFEVIKYIKLNKIKTKIILTANNENQLNEYGLNTNSMRRLGIAEVLVKPFALNYLIELITSGQNNQGWRNIKQNDSATIEEEVSARDETFTSIKIDEFCCGNVAIFDLFIRLGKNKFLKILNAGDFFEQSRINHYKNEKNIEHLYFKTKDRGQYINFLNNLIGKIINDPKVPDRAKFNLTKSLTEKYVEGIYISGISENVYEEGRSVCDNIFEMISKSQDLSRLLKEQSEFEDNMMTHLFLTSLFSSIICNKMGWCNKMTRDTIAFGAFLHDIGKIKLPKHIKDKKSWELTPDQFVEYQRHCEYGVKLLAPISLVTEQIRQIVYQHHELVNGKGFPSEISSAKIFPLAQVVGFSNMLANKVVATSSTPISVMKTMVQQQTEIFNYSPDIVKAFIAGLVKNE